MDNKFYQVSLSDKIKSEMNKDVSLLNVNKHNTPLNANEFNEFYDWAIKKYGNKDAILYEIGNYDLQGAWKDMKNGAEWYTQTISNPQLQGETHLPDIYKKPNHITFSEESKYSNDINKGGRWVDENGVKYFSPSNNTVKLYGEKYLKDYFNKYEKEYNIKINK